MADVRIADPSFTPAVRVSSVRFLTFTSEEVKKLSCKRITNPTSFDGLLHPTLGGLYDPALGPSDKHELCGTCGLNYVHCPGHMGHITLPLPVFHPIFFTTLYRILQTSCLSCHHFLTTKHKCHLLKAQMRLLDHGLVSDALELECHFKNGSNEGRRNTTDTTSCDDVVQYVDECIKKKDKQHINGGQPTLEKSKHLTDLRLSLVQDFFRAAKSTKCSHCQAPSRKIRHEYQNKVMIRGLSAKQAGAWATSANRERMKLEGLRTEKDVEGTVALMSSHKITPELCMEQHYLSPLEAREHLHLMWRNDPLLMKAVFSSLNSNEHLYDAEKRGTCPTDMFFVDTIPVPPSRFRPISTLGAKKFENSQTTNLQKILQDCLDIQEILAERRNPVEESEPDKKPKLSLNERLQVCWSTLQMNVNTYMDSDINKKIRDAPNGIKQVLEKKEGLFRKHMMGKRVNYAARSVISPDPNINMDEIGIPLVFATRLTYPEPVTFWNIHELRQAVINGPYVHPGATHVQSEDGSLILLNNRNFIQRLGLARRLLAPDKLESSKGSTKKVFRHLKNGDVLLLNRQPTLHKPSIMAHKARVLPGEKTLRLHYANCKTYNADFDGDEMNAHFPQNELARSEAYNIASTHYQYLVPKDGTPLSGLIQDHVVSGVLMTIRGRFFTWEDYQKLLFMALPNFTSYFKLIPPCILKPKRLWSGKQVISTLLLNLIPGEQDKLNLVSKTKISSKEWTRHCQVKKKSKFNDDIMTESEVVFREGQLMCGVLDKSQFGASQFGFVHSCFELYGGLMCNLLLSSLGRIFTAFLQLHGFTLGVEDILIMPKADSKRRKIIKEGRMCGAEAAAEAFAVKNPEDTHLIREKYEDVHHSLDGSGMKVLDFFVKKRTDHFNNQINTTCVPAGLHKSFPDNSLQLMVQSGAKGSTVNCMQISCLLGQIELEGQRPPLMISGKSLPSFEPYDTSPRARGFVDGRFLTGIRPQEYFFHCMAGREGLVDTAVKTSRSGYLQRCLIKHLEGISVQYDLTVRDSDGSVIQFLYGEDGLDISKTRFLIPRQMMFLRDNYRAYLYQLNPQAAVSSLDSIKAEKYQRKVDRWKRKNAVPRLRQSGFLDFYEHHLPEMRAKFPNDQGCIGFNFRTKADREVIDKWYGSSPMLRSSMNKKYVTRYPPTVSMYSPDYYFGSIPEKLTDEVNKYITQEDNKKGLLNISPDNFKALIHFKSLRALADPGEAVGLLAAQSVGEPSTQMTLNTFHFAGRGEMNVTLGIPRLREILMIASPNIKTPAMDVPLLPRPDAKEQGEKLKKTFTRVLLADVLDQVEVWESMGREGKGFRHCLYHIKMSFLDPKYYKDDYVVNPSMILAFIESQFIKRLISAVNKEIKSIRDKKLTSTGVTIDKEIRSRTLQNIDVDADQSISENPVAPAEDDDEDTEVSDVDEEGHADSSKQMKRKKQHVSYEDADDEDDEALTLAKEKDEDGEYHSAESELEEDADTSRKTSKKRKIEEAAEFDEDMITSAHLRPIPAKFTVGMDSQKIQDVVGSSSNIVDYVYDAEDGLWCQVSVKFASVDCKVMIASLFEKLASKVVVWQVPYVKKGFLAESQLPGSQGVLHLKTEGVNLHELWKYEDILDLRKSYTNNIHSVANTFGIEAAGKAIIREMSGVFGVYGIDIDYRHLSLIADYMTFDGSYKPFNRFGMESNSSPFQQMSFETTMKFLHNATVQGDTDTLQSPSACLVTGRVVRTGTGCFELLQKLY